MKLYADRPGRAARQVVSDLAAVLLVWLFVRLGRAVHDLVARLAEPAVAIGRAGEGLTDAAERGASGVEGVPLVGEALARPFTFFGDSGRTLAEAGARQSEAVLDLAFGLGLVVAALPILVLLALYLPPRLRWVRAATAARRFAAADPDLRLLALRALVTRPLAEVRRASADPIGDYEAGRFAALAELEFAALGLRSRGTT